MAWRQQVVSNLAWLDDGKCCVRQHEQVYALGEHPGTCCAAFTSEIRVPVKTLAPMAMSERQFDFYDGGKVQIVSEVTQRKFVRVVEHRTFSGERARKQGQRVLYVTERCVFRLAEAGAWS